MVFSFALYWGIARGYRLPFSSGFYFVTERYQKLKQSQIDLAYTAGIVDGEGCITIQKGEMSTIICKVTNTNQSLVEWLKNEYGGSVQKGFSKNKNAKPAYGWYIKSKKAAVFLYLLVPYLRMKKEQAEICLELRRLSFDKECVEHCSELVARLKELNKRGNDDKAG